MLGSSYRDPTQYGYSEGNNPDSLAGLTKRVEALEAGGGGGGTTDYNKLKNLPTINGNQVKGALTTDDLDISYNDVDDKPKINHVELTGDKDSKEDLGIVGGEVDDITQQDLENMWTNPLP